MSQDFTTRQYMESRDFEFFHYKSNSMMEIGYHNHDFYEIYYLISGRVTYMVEGNSYKLKPGDILLINNQELHKPIIEEGESYERYVIWVHPDFLIRHSSETDSLLTCFESSSKNKVNLLRLEAEILDIVKETFSRFKKILNDKSFGSEILEKLYLTELLVYLNRAFVSTHSSMTELDIEFSEKVNRVIKYINSNLETGLTLDKISSKFYISKFHLLKEFKKYTGYTIYQYIKQKRLILAKMLLKEGLSVTEVSMQCGFGDYSNFIRSFKKVYGVTPKKYYQR